MSGYRDAADAIIRQPAYTIREVAERLGVTLRTLRYYESRGLIHPRREGRNRVYGPVETARLTQIGKARAVGFSLREIEAMLISPEGAHDLPRLTRDQIDSQIAHLEQQHAIVLRALDQLYRVRAEMMADGRWPWPLDDKGPPRG